LIAEDDAMIVTLYEEGLGDEMFDKRFAVSGKAALEIYSEWHPDIIILDIMMPIMTGYSVLKTIRTELKDDETTIIMSTSLSNSRDIQDCLQLGIQGYIVKPFSLKEIGNRVISSFQQHKSSLMQ
jgi:DNA-binding response OmpR family regulator